MSISCCFALILSISIHLGQSQTTKLTVYLAKGTGFFVNVGLKVGHAIRLCCTWIMTSEAYLPGTSCLTSQLMSLNPSCSSKSKLRRTSTVQELGLLFPYIRPSNTRLVRTLATMYDPWKIQNDFITTLVTVYVQLSNYNLFTFSYILCFCFIFCLHFMYTFVYILCIFCSKFGFTFVYILFSNFALILVHFWLNFCLHFAYTFVHILFILSFIFCF